MSPDLTILSTGSVVALRANTDDARDWIEQNVESTDWNWNGRVLYVEHRYAADLIDGMPQSLTLE